MRKESKNQAAPVDSDLTISTEAYAHIPARAFEMFGNYLSEVAGPSIGAEIKTEYEPPGNLTARIEDDGFNQYTIRLFGGLVSALSVVHAGIERIKDSGANETFEDISNRLSKASFVKGERAPPASSAEPLRLSLLLSLCFTAFHEFAHLRCGHFSRLYPKSKRFVGKRDYALVKMESPPKHAARRRSYR